jgi:hypothetical protein
VGPVRQGDLDAGGLPHHPHLLLPWLVEGEEEGAPGWLVSRHLAGGGLDTVIRRRGGLPAGGSGGVLRAGEASAIALGVGRALAALHAAGRVFGPLRASDVVLDEGGDPVLDGARLVPGGDHGAPPGTGDRAVPGGAGEHTEAGDVMSLAALLAANVRGPVPPGLAKVLAWAGGQGDQLPTAAELVARVVAACPPETVMLVSPLTGLTASRRQAPGVVRRARRPAAVVAGIAAALSLAVGGGVAWSRLSDAGPDPADPAAAVAPVSAPGATSDAPGASGDWSTVLTDLDSRRDAAFARLDASLVVSVDAPGSRALMADMAALRSLLAAGVHPSGLRSVVRSVAVLSVTSDSARLSVTDERPGYRLVRADGAAVLTRPARGVATWQVVLVRRQGRWAVSEVAAA